MGPTLEAWGLSVLAQFSGEGDDVAFCFSKLLVCGGYPYVPHAPPHLCPTTALLLGHKDSLSRKPSCLPSSGRHLIFNIPIPHQCTLPAYRTPTPIESQTLHAFSDRWRRF
ncbi:hypothetical protein Tsp_03514 [Trichinella spiralis]|uniref:hypothetical protein n=1 Tax=Trichinella spiralis TaxID=6334 RepID=UPI0001EFB41E|nr:hypothetical protein Tsp_03514 [Trichinella spiralis]